MATNTRESTESDEEAFEFEGNRYRDQQDTSHHYRHNRDRSPRSHKRTLLEEIGGAYALGEGMIGHRKHHVAHLVSVHQLHVLSFATYNDVDVSRLHHTS
jgi:hypothetical protein